MEAPGEILLLPLYGQGHLLPCMELCKRLSSLNYRAILIISSNLSSSVPSSIFHHPLVEVTQLPSSPPPLDSLQLLPPPSEMVDEEGEKPTSGPNPFHHDYQQLGTGIKTFLLDKYVKPDKIRPVCVVIDVMMSWSKEIFGMFDIPAVTFFTSGACSAAMKQAAWKSMVRELKPGEIRKFDGLPEEMALTSSDLKRQERAKSSNHRCGPPRWVNGTLGERKFGRPPFPGDRPIWLDEIEDSLALCFNTCDQLEHQFLSYIAKTISKPVFGVGPLLPEQYLNSFNSILLDGQVRSNGKSNYTEDEMIQWLDSKAARSVVYVSFGSEVGPSMEEYEALADALGELNRPFIWVIQPGSGRRCPSPGFLGEESNSPPRRKEEEGYHPHGLDEKVGDRGLIVKGWAPQLLILTHPSLGGFLSHCGWNSTVEAIGRGIPILAWPIRGDQFHNAKLVVKHFKVGRMLLTSENPAELVKKDSIKTEIYSLLDDVELHRQAQILRRKLTDDFPAIQITALKSFIDLIVQKN